MAIILGALARIKADVATLLQPATIERLRHPQVDVTNGTYTVASCETAGG